ncbi:oocyte zinc finger protein XlCOF6-like [Culicoides brevitarsis]|uniref:oocyte zinc finger protein XlCOF6-like n=1 Tax=Culicoides brevitarsis TaxID=469753 RepID=UPI00307C7150
MQSFCRLCGLEVSLKDSENVLESTKLLKSIKILLNLVIKPDDSYQRVCISCSQKVQNFFVYYEEVHKIQVDLDNRKLKDFIPISPKIEIEDDSCLTFTAELNIKQEPEPTDQVIADVVCKEDEDFDLPVDNCFEDNLDDDEADKSPEDNDSKKAEYKELSEKINKFFDFTCKKCDLDLGNPFGYQLHMKRRHKKPNAKITCCGIEIPSVRRDLVVHYYSHTNVEAISCRFCGKKCKSITYLKKHERNHIEKLTKSAQVACEECGKMMVNSRSLRQHMVNFHKPIEERQQFQCDYCGKILHTKSSLVTHFLQKHKVGKARPVKKQTEEAVLCPVCAKSFQTDAGFRCHFKATHDIEKVICPECGQEVNKVSLKNHIKRQHDHVKATCDICLKEFRNIHTVLQHKNRVHIEPRHCCDMCDKKFKTKDKLRDHRRGHFVENRFHCDLCTVTCNDYSNMLKHRKQVHQAPPIPKGMGRKILEIGFQA